VEFYEKNTIRKKWCPGEDSNFHDRNGHWHLKPARLPIPPPGLAKGQMPSFRHFPASAMKAQHNYNRLSVNPFIGAGHIGSFLGFIFLIRQRASQPTRISEHHKPVAGYQALKMGI